MGIDTKIILIPCIVSDILTKEGFSIMAALICILGFFPVMTEWHHSDSWRAHLGGIETAKRLCTDSIARFSKNLGFGSRTTIP